MASSNARSRDEQWPLPPYDRRNPIGTGAFANVVLAKHLLTRQKVAVKILNRAKMRQQRMSHRVEREIKIMRLLKHPHIVGLYEAIVTDENVYIVMELAKSGQLYDYVVSHGKLHEGEARRVFQQIVSAVAYCHQNMVVHRDLKMENILLDSENNIKIADFGLSNFFKYNQYLSSNCGSRHYASPELLEGRYVGPEVDVWSCGVILYGLLCGRLTFDEANESALLRRIRSGKFTIPSILPDQARDLISGMLTVNPSKRLTMKEVREHPWLQVCIPHYLAMPPLHARRQLVKINDEIVEEVARYGFDRNSLVESLQNGVENEATVTYHLILHKRFDAPTRYFWTVYEETASTALDQTESCGRPERKWNLGLEFHDCPREIMHKVANTLQELDVFHRNRGHYNMACAWFPSLPNISIIQSFLDPEPYGGGGGRRDGGGASSDVRNIDPELQRPPGAVLFEIQLYKAWEGNYVLDLKRTSGPQFRYLNLCSQLICQLRMQMPSPFHFP